MNTDAIYAEISELRRDLESMNPKLSIYQKSLKRYQELQELVGGQGKLLSTRPNKNYRLSRR